MCSQSDSNTNILQSSCQRYLHQLIVIGNGFDLECGLKSSFGDFIRARKEQFDSTDGEGINTKLKFQKTLWDVILAGNDKENWCDIEGAIANWLPCSTCEVPEPLASFVQCSKNLEKFFKNGIPVMNVNNLADGVVKYLTTEPKPSADLNEFREKFSKLKKFSNEDLLQISKKDLATYENDFSNYLKNELQKNVRYAENAKKLLHDLMLNDSPRYQNYEYDYSVLSFNYTPNPMGPLIKIGNAFDYINIHGRLGGEIVFGIDGTQCMDDPCVVPFTKTYRLMGLDLRNGGNLIHPVSTRMHIGRDEGTIIIKFYGHSLGDADYSYFQAIFDSVNLYESATKLVFYFRPHGRKSMEEARKEMMDKTIRLLVAYGKTLENKDHGKNLIHKLLLEGRLSVTELQTMNL